MDPADPRIVKPVEGPEADLTWARLRGIEAAIAHRLENIKGSMQDMLEEVEALFDVHQDGAGLNQRAEIVMLNALIDKVGLCADAIWFRPTRGLKGVLFRTLKLEYVLRNWFLIFFFLASRIRLLCSLQRGERGTRHAQAIRARDVPHQAGV